MAREHETDSQIANNKIMTKPKVKEKKTPEKSYLYIIQNHVQLKKEDKKYNNCILYSVLKKLLEKMQDCDILFESLKPKLAYLGSYFDRLRVGRPTEYDINVILTLPMNYNKVQLQDNVQNGYTSIKMPSEFRRLSKIPATATKGFQDTELWCNTNHLLSVKRFRSWMQSVVDAVLNSLPKVNGQRVLKVNNKSYIISAKMSGPANTILITECENPENNIDVDLVPTLAFFLPKHNFQGNLDVKKITVTKVPDYFVVPKPSEHDHSWRLAFPYQERFYIQNKNNLKSTLKLIKLLRDVQGFKKLASYYIKTLFLWESAETNDDFWKKSLTFLVPYMIKKLKDSLEKHLIKNFWFPEHNLLEKIKVETCQIWCNRLTRIVIDIEKNQKNYPEVIKKYFTPSCETNKQNSICSNNKIVRDS